MRRSNPTRGTRARQAGIAILAAISVGFSTGCRDGEDLQAANFIPLIPSKDGNHGCATPNQVFPGAVNPMPVDLGGFVLGEMSRVASASFGDLLFMTGASADVLELDVSDVNAPIPRTLVAPGVIDALIAGAGVAQPAVLSGVAVVDAGNLVVVEHSSNTLLLVSRVVPDMVTIVAGLPDANGGFSDGLSGQIRFNFEAATTLVPTSNGQLYVADSGNHAIRQVTFGVVTQVLTIAGTGAQGFNDGALASARFDTPTGLTVACDGRLFISEAGGAGGGGNRLRALSIGSLDFFGRFTGFAETLAGDGQPLSIEDVGEDASLAGPSALFGTAEGEVYFVDGLTGHLRRFAVGSGLVDCPLDANGCMLAMGALAGSENVGITVTPSGQLFFLLGTLGTLLRYDPN